MLVHNSWTDASFIDVVTVGVQAQRVILQRRDPLPPIPAIVDDYLFRSLATLLMARDVVQRAEATVDGLARPEDTDGRFGAGEAHESYWVTRLNASYSIDAALTAIEAGQRDAVLAPSNGGSSGYGYLFLGMVHQPNAAAAAFGGRHPASGSPETSAATKALAARIVAALAAQHAANAAIDAGLADDVDTAFTAKRAELLAIAEQWFPGVYV